MRKGNKIFLIIIIIAISIQILGLIEEFYGIIKPESNIPLYFFSLSVWIGVPWIIYRCFVYRKEKRKNAIQHA